MIMMLAFAMAQTAYELTGKPIECIHDGFRSERVLNAFCMAENIYTVRQQTNAEGNKDQVEVYPGVPGHYYGWETDQIYHVYYRYTPLYFLLQAICFYAPKYLWKNLEGGQIGNMIQDLSAPGQTLDAKRLELIKHCASCLFAMKNTTQYAMSYHGCMVINLINVILQFFLTNLFINEGEFYYYGSDVAKFFSRNKNVPFGAIKNEHLSPMNFVFPRQAKCSIKMFGPSGTLVEEHAICFLTMNSFNDKIFVVIWFWFVFLMIVTPISIAWSILVWANQSLRMRYNKVPSSYNFVLDLLKKNVDEITFSKIVEELETLLLRKNSVEDNDDLTSDRTSGDQDESDNNESKPTESVALKMRKLKKRATTGQDF